MCNIRFLKEFPEYVPILAFWAFREWYSKRSIDFNIVIKAYKERIGDCRMPIGWVAIEDRIPVGMVSLKEKDLWIRKDLHPWLSSLFVLPEYRNQGIGKMLINTVMEKAKELHFNGLYLFTDGGDISISHYYDHIGWTFLEKVKGNDENEVKIYFNKL